jgi:hypothetical protein
MGLDFLLPGKIKKRDQFNNLLNKRVGEGNWFWAFKVKDKLYSWDFGMQLYEDAYYHFLEKNIFWIKKLTSYSDCYVINNKDLESELNYRNQNQRYSDHLQDIAIRRCLVRFGVSFKGKDIFKIKDSDIDDTRVPFHLPHLIRKPNGKSIRAWYNSSRVVVIAQSIEDKLELGEKLIS